MNQRSRCLISLAFLAGCSSAPTRGPDADEHVTKDAAPPHGPCDVVGSLPASEAITEIDAALEAAGVTLPPARDDGFARACSLDAFECRANAVSIFKTSDPRVAFVGFTTTGGEQTLSKLDAPTLAGCEAPTFNTTFNDKVAIAERAFHCAHDLGYSEWLVADAATGETLVKVVCEGDGALELAESGLGVTIRCRGATFQTTIDELRGCYAG